MPEILPEHRIPLWVIGKIAPFLFDRDGNLDTEMIRMALDTHVPPDHRAWVLDRILDFAAGLKAAEKTG